MEDSNQVPQEETEIALADPIPVRTDVNGRPVISISELITRCQESATKMGRHNPNRYLLMNCAYALRQLVDRLAFHEREGALRVKS